MTLVNNFLRKIITDRFTDYCCLCFETVDEKNSLYNLRDEIILETKSVEDIYEILFTILGEEVMNCLTTSTICKKCTTLAINSYNFIETCKNNIKRLSCNIDCIQNYIVNATGYNYCHKSLFLVLDTVNCTVDEFYDKNSHRYDESLCKRFENLVANSLGMQNIGNSLTLDIHFDPENCEMTKPVPDMSSKIKTSIQEEKKEESVRKISQPVKGLQALEANDKGDYKCEHCHKDFKSSLKLKLHYLRVHAPKTFKCTQCPRSFGSSLILSLHIRDSHCTAVCRYCGKTYTNNYSLKYHEKSHEVDFKCNNCGKVYKKKKSFNNHVKQNLCNSTRNVNLEPKHACNYCDKKYSQISALNVHLRLEHGNGKVLTCDWCGKKLSSESKLKEHIIKHTKQKNYTCDICGGKFVTKTSLLYHTRLHTGEKPYKCEHCDMRFLSASRRSEHIKQYHDEPDLECDICHCKFKGRTPLMRHKKRHFDTSSKLYQYLTNKP
ncbi:unnamed protein product [Arctia plantaginis]|uniref:C2H2-type domain-containing protein n=1 Tax=Arctia plantaginis TaxID=874455 RepID=A0A8S1AG04_ARCPL|nr:unnamed protein product [Arctia plantaginis]